MRIFLLAPAMIALLMQPASSEDFDAKERKAAQERKELEIQHKATLDRMPNQTKKADPWGNVRSSEPAKKKNN